MSTPVYANETDRTLLNRIQQLALETPNNGASMSTTQFGDTTAVALQNVIQALDQAQKDFVRDSGIIAWHVGFEGDSNTGLGVTPEVERVPLPQDMMDVRRRAWISYGAPGIPTGPTSYVVNDSSGASYILTITDAGLASTASTSPQTPAPIQLNAAGFTANSFQFVIDLSTHQFETQSIAYNAALPTAIPIQSTNFGWNWVMYQEFPNIYVLEAVLQLRSANVAGVQELPTEDSWTTDSWMPDWETNFSKPIVANESLSAIPSLYLAPPSSDVGQLDVLYVPVAATLSNTGVALSVPPDFSPYIVWRALFLLLTSQTEAADPQRARYCAQRYQEGVMLAKSLVFRPNILDLGLVR